MKTRCILIAACAAVPPCAASAQPVHGPYVSLGAGVDLLQNQVVRGTGAYADIPKYDFRFNPGFAGQVSAGYGFGNGFRAELEGDYANSHVRSAGYFIPQRAGGYEQQYGGFVNGLYDFDLHLGVTPYVGAGVGYREVELDGVNAGSTGQRIAPTGARQNGNFAYQGIAGASIPLDGILPGLALTAEYRFVGVVPLDYRRSSIIDVPVPAGLPPRAPPGATTSDLPLPSFSPAFRQVVQRIPVEYNDIFNHELLLGVRYAFYTPPPPAPPSPPPAPPRAEVARTYLVFFDWDKATLTDRARQIVAQAAGASTQVQTTRIEVDGYTDTSGTPRYNQGLSVRRADAVAAELVRDGVPKAEISVRGYGETRLLVQTGPGVREPQNRRVEIILR